LSVILVGDFNQLGPVGTALTFAVLNVVKHDAETSTTQ
jgi:hypothetical protein